MITHSRFPRQSAHSLALALLAAAALVGVAGCSKDKDVEPPAELVKLVTKRDVNVLWSQGLGGKSENLRLALRPAVSGGVVYAASHDGEVVAYDAQSGRNKWSVKTKLALSAGPEVANDVVVLGSSDGEVILLDAATGAKRWQQSIKSEILARPLVANDLVVIRTVDGHVEGLALADGATRWAVDEQVPRLTLRGTAPPVLAGDKIIAGFDNGRVIAIDSRKGDVLWDTIVNAPHGRTELERLSDIDSPVRVAGEDVFVVGFNGRVAMLALDSGQIWWARDASSYRGFVMDDDNLYLTTADSTVMAMKRVDGSVVWEQTAMKRRGLTAPAIDDDALVVGDYQGYIHWLNKATGEIVARHKSDGERISNAAITDEGRTFVQTDSGKLLAFRSSVAEHRTAASAPPPADSATAAPAPSAADSATAAPAPSEPDSATAAPAPSEPDSATTAPAPSGADSATTAPAPPEADTATATPPPNQ